MIKPNQSNAGEGIKLYTGVASFRIVGINPSQEELKKLGYKAEKAPVYKDAEKFGTKVAFFLEATAPGGDKIRTNDAYFLKNKVREGIFINKEGNFSSDATKVSGEVRNPFEGEIELLEFVRNWANLKKGETCYLETIDKIIENADVTELRQIAKAVPDNQVQKLCTVRDGKYQSVYNRKTERAYGTDYSYLHKDLAKNQSYIKEDLGGIDFKLYVADQFKLKPWKGNTAEVAQTATATTSSNGTAAHADAAASDEAPF